MLEILLIYVIGFMLFFRKWWNSELMEDRNIMRNIIIISVSSVIFIYEVMLRYRVGLVLVIVISRGFCRFEKREFLKICRYFVLYNDMLL